jgi:hypothetical protein
VAVALVALPTTALARGESWVITGVVDGGCNSSESTFDISVVYPDGGNFFQNTMVFEGADVYMDEDVTISNAESELDTWSLFDLNQRGRQTANFPLPTDTPYRMTNEIKNSDGEMVWESTIIVDACNDPDITLNSHGPASQRLSNKGFEKAGSSQKDAKKWGGDSAGLSKRYCDPESDRVFEGECALQFKPEANQASSVKQNASPDLVEVDDVIRLEAMVRAEGLQGGGKLKAVVKYKDGSKDKINIDIPEGDYDYMWLADDVVVSGDVEKVQVKISTKKGSGRFYVDEVMLTEIANGIPLPAEPVIMF